jgi:hypothetical protein
VDGCARFSVHRPTWHLTVVKPGTDGTYPDYMLESWAEAQGAGETIAALKRRSSTGH